MIVNRILQLIDLKGLSKNKFYKQTGLSNGFLDKVKDIGASKIEYILNTYPDINAEWLLTGRGPMRKLAHMSRYDEGKYIVENYNSTSFTEEQSKPDPLVENVQKGKNQLIPLYKLEASNGLVQLFQGNQIRPIDYLSIPDLPQSDGALYIIGDSMYPLLKSGDIVIYKQVRDIAKSLYWGEMYIMHIDIEGDTFTTVKYMHKSELGSEYVKLVNQNTQLNPQNIQLKHIKAAALVKASIRINTMI